MRAMQETQEAQVMQEMQRMRVMQVMQEMLVMPVPVCEPLYEPLFLNNCVTPP